MCIPEDGLINKLKKKKEKEKEDLLIDTSCVTTPSEHNNISFRDKMTVDPRDPGTFPIV